MLIFTPVGVALFSTPFLGERPSRRQGLGLGVLLVGVGAYFYPLRFPTAELVGLGVMVVALVGNALPSVLGRRFNRLARFSSLTVTTLSMGFGSLVLLGAGVAAQGVPYLTPENWLVVGWLAVVNTAFAFTLWNRTLQTLSAVESIVINNTMLVQVAVLGWAFLGEALTAFDLIAIGLVGVGALLVQLRGRT